MTNTTTDEDRRRRVIRIAWTLALLLHLVALAIFVLDEDLRTDTLSVDREEIKEKGEAATRRAREREERERNRREEIELPKEHAENLRKEEERKRREAIVERVEDIRKAYEEVKAVEAERLDFLEEQALEQKRTSERETISLLRLAEAVVENGEELERVTADLDGGEALRAEIGRFLPSARRARSAAGQLAQSRRNPDPADRDALLLAARQLDGQMAVVTTQVSEIDAEEALVQSRAQTAGTVETFVREVERLYGKDAEAYAQELVHTPEPIEDGAVMEKAEKLEELATDELYETAVELERKLAERFENARAAELAALEREKDRDFNFQEAKERLADLGEPRRPELGDEIRKKKVQTVGDLNEYRETLDKALAETEQMRAQARNRMKQLNPDAESDGKSAEPRGMDIAATNLQRKQALAEAVRQHDARSLDLTGMMGSAAGASEGSNKGKRTEEILGEGSSGSFGSVALPEAELSEGIVLAKALPGRRFTDDAARQGWLYIDTWYIIGPWGLGDYDEKALPPQTEINLDAVYYNGKKGTPRRSRTKNDRLNLTGELRWQFHQSDSLFVRPPNETGDAIYFAYTELYFDRPRDILIAVGIDDESSVWINGDRIWAHTMKGWDLGASLRKVSFKQGYNTVLIRMDNGAPLMDFSLVFCSPEALELSKGG